MFPQSYGRRTDVVAQNNRGLDRKTTGKETKKGN